MLHFLAAAAEAHDPTEHVVPHVWFYFGSHAHPWFVFTSQMFMALLSALLLILILPRLFRDAKGDAPSGARNFFESTLEFLRVEVFRPALKEHTDRFVPLLWSIFFFILFANLLGQIPVNEIATLLTHKEHVFWGTATGAATTTGALALCAFIF